MIPCGTFSVYSSAAAPASRPPSRNVNMMMRSRDTPISVAVFGSWATARMPRPNFVRLIARSVSTARTNAAAMMTRVTLETVAPKIVN